MNQTHQEAYSPALDPVLALSVQREQVLDAIDAAVLRRDDDDASLHARFAEIDARFVSATPTTVAGAMRKLAFAAGIAETADYVEAVGQLLDSAISALPDRSAAMPALDRAARLCAVCYGPADPITLCVQSVTTAVQRGPLAA